ncbi:Rgg/GadR/MutR family transcriptional regulator [Lactococcus garvieae]|uniref:Rgg/GadR/MutR family transcriptional regulator n=1 Tax=Lactococcus garvieae TaxID=1363 RepID=UPI003852A02D
MVYKRYGTTFKNIRKQNNFTLSDFAEVGIPTSTLSDFERGLTVISLEKIDLALQLMGYSLSDFDSHLNYYTITEPIHILIELENAILLKDEHKLKELHEICETTYQKYICLTIKLKMSEATIEEKNELIDYLYDTKAFGVKELYIFYMLMPKLPPQDILNIMKRIKLYAKGMANSYNYHRHLSHVLIEVIIVLSTYGLKDEAYYFIQQIENRNLAQSMLLRNLFEAAKGLWISHFQDKASGITQVTRVLKILHLAASPEVAEYYQEKFEKSMGLLGYEK